MRAPSRSRPDRASLRPTFDNLESRRLLTLTFANHLDPPRATPHQTTFTNLVYSQGASGPLRLDVRLPAGRAPAGGWPVVLAIHGGGWRKFDKTEYEPQVDPTLLAAGFAVVAPNYTLSAPGRPSWPRNLDELRQAVRWVKENAPAFGFNPAEVAAMGESAGGHLALMLGTSPGPVDSSGATARVDAVVDYFGPTDLAALYQESRAAAPAVLQYLGGTPLELPGQYADASPVGHVSAASAPVLIAQGTGDDTVPLAQSQELVQALNTAKVPNQLITVKGGVHGFGLAARGLNLIPPVIGFLRTYLAGGHVVG
jgi:acetyl esterase/lipase